MRKTIVAGNWKMNKDLSEAVNLISGIKNRLNSFEPNCDVIICPPFISLETAGTLIKNSKIYLGAQNMHYENSGAFTGETSAKMLLSVGCEYVILGHSERRNIFGESDELINKKILQALSNKLKPIFCIGESLDEREKDITKEVIERQIKQGLKNLDESDISKIIIAYEPIWAIGTGKTASPEQAQEVHKFIRNLISSMYSESAAENLTILYGGSVKPNNASDLLKKQDIDGGLIGGASLDAEAFIEIIKSA